MKKLIIDELRKRSCVPGKQRTWIAELSDDQLYELFRRFRSGQKAKPIARYIQKKWAVKPNSSVHAISQGILKFQKRIADLLKASFNETNESQTAIREELEDTAHFGTLERNERIAQRLRDRIERMIKEEKETDIATPYLSRDVQALTAFEKMIVRQKDWELKHADEDPVKRRELERKNRKIDSLFNTYMEKTTEDDRDRTIMFLEKLVDKIDEYSVPVEKLPDGNWILLEQEKDR